MAAPVLRRGDPGEVGVSPERIRLLGQRCREWVERGETTAIVGLVARRGVVVFHEAFGRLRPEPEAPALTTDAIFPVSSISKPIAATVALSLVEDGLLALNRPVQEYVPEFVGDGKAAVLVRHLLTHTSGLRDEDVVAWTSARNGRTPAHPADTSVVHATFGLSFGVPPRTPPGVEMAYCNYNFALLGEIVRRVTGKASFREPARGRLLDPLGMHDTHHEVPEDVWRRVIRRPADGPYAGLNHRPRLESHYSAGAVSTTAWDLAVFGQMLLNGGRYGDARVLSPASVREMTRNQIPGVSARWGDRFFPEAGWGYGWNVPSERGFRAASLASTLAFEHVGAGSSLIWVDPTSDLVIVYFCVVLELSAPWEPRWNADLFVDIATAAVE